MMEKVGDNNCIPSTLAESPIHARLNSSRDTIPLDRTVANQRGQTKTLIPDVKGILRYLARDDRNRLQIISRLIPFILEVKRAISRKGTVSGIPKDDAHIQKLFHKLHKACTQVLAQARLLFLADKSQQDAVLFSVTGGWICHAKVNRQELMGNESVDEPDLDCIMDDEDDDNIEDDPAEESGEIFMDLMDHEHLNAAYASLPPAVADGLVRGR